MTKNAISQEFLDIVDNIKNGIDIDINKEKLRKFSQKDFNNYYRYLNKQRGVNFEDTILKAQMINIDPSNKWTFGFDLRKYSTDEIENFLTSEIDYIDSGKYFDKNKYFDIDKAIDDIVDPRMNGFEIVKNTNWYAGRKTGRIGWLGEEIEGSIDSGNWKRTDKFVDLENQEIRYVINETRVNPETGQVEVVNKNNVFTKDKDGNLIPYEFKNKKEEAVYAEKNPFLLDRDDNTVLDVEKELGRKVERSRNQVDTIEHTAINEYMNAVENGEITKPVGNNNSSTSAQQEIVESKKRRRGNAGSVFKELNENSQANTTQNSATSSSQQNTSTKPNGSTTANSNSSNNANNSSAPKKISQARQDKIEKQRIRRILKDDYKKNAGSGGNPKIEEIKRRRKQRKDQIKKVNQLDDDVKTLARFEKNRKRAEELKKKAYTDKNLTTQERLDILDEVKRIENEHPKREEYRRKKQELDRDTTITTKERLKREQELKKEYSYDGLKNRIENADRSVVEEYLEKRQGVISNNKDYDQFMKDLDLAGRDFVDADGNELSSGFKEFNKKTRKMGLKIKGFITGDYSDYNEYIEAVERLENMGPRNFDRYDIDNLFNSNGNLNSADDVLNLKPTSRTSAKDAFDNWRTGRKNARTRAATKGVPKNTRGVAAAKEAVLRSAPNAKKLFTVQGTFGVGLNLFNAKATYDEERKEGHGVFSSLARAGADFALGEILGMKYMGLMAAQAAPRMAVKGIEGLGKLTREKNNMQRHEAFGYASFQDTQQLATMRQSGMEMAKMANYNLQQTLMGNEAKYMHR